MSYEHVSVLLQPAVDALISVEGRRTPGIYVDGTFGRGGHSRLLLSKLGEADRLVVFDKDPQAIAEAHALRAQDARVEVVHDSFAALPQVLKSLGAPGLRGVMLDLGVSSPQIDEAARGFSFMRDGPLDMRMDTSRGQTAAQWLAEADVQEMKEVIADYGEERFAFQIAKAIAARREDRPLCTTLELAELVASVVRTREKGQHPATRTFQAIRIHVNKELEELAYALASVLRSLESGGRLSVISFHSLEDRLVKQCLALAGRPAAELARLPIAEKDMPRPWVRVLGRVLPTAEEVAANPRARSAVLRIAERTDEPLGPEFDRAMAFLPSVRRAPPGKTGARRRGVRA